MLRRSVHFVRFGVVSSGASRIIFRDRRVPSMFSYPIRKRHVSRMDCVRMVANSETIRKRIRGLFT
jgi:hypothetical protein